MKTDTNSGRHLATLLTILLSVLVLGASALGATEKSPEAERDVVTMSRADAGSADSPRRSAHAHRSPSRHRHRSHVYVSWDFPFFYPAIHLGVGPRYYGDEIGALDLDISPEEAQIYLDGELIGTADNFDGFPEFLWLEEGTYDLVFYHPNYETIARQYTIYAGVVIDVEDKMQPGTGVRPEDLVSRSTENRDRRLQREREREIEAERMERREREWEEQREREREIEAERMERVSRDDGVGRLHLSVWPEDTALYLNGHFLGTGDELSQLSAGLIVPPGKHLLEAVHPEYESEEITISVTPGERVDLEIELKRP